MSNIANYEQAVELLRVDSELSKAPFRLNARRSPAQNPRMADEPDGRTSSVECHAGELGNEGQCRHDVEHVNRRQQRDRTSE